MTSLSGEEELLTGESSRTIRKLQYPATIQTSRDRLCIYFARMPFNILEIRVTLREIEECLTAEKSDIRIKNERVRFGLFEF